MASEQASRAATASASLDVGIGALPGSPTATPSIARRPAAALARANLDHGIKIDGVGPLATSTGIK